MVHTVVVVDDDLHTLDVLQLLLSIRGINVVAFERADGVVEAIRELKPDVVLLDLRMPEDRRAGLHLLAQLRGDDTTAQVPVILMSADHAALVDYAARLTELHALPLTKPVERNRLYQMVEQAAA